MAHAYRDALEAQLAKAANGRQQGAMKTLLLAAISPIVLAGCIPFISEGNPYPATLPGYESQVLSQSSPLQVAECIGRLYGVQAVADQQGGYSVSLPNMASAAYLVRSVTKSGVTQTQTMIAEDLKSTALAEQAVLCAATPAYTPAA